MKYKVFEGFIEEEIINDYVNFDYYEADGDNYFDKSIYDEEFFMTHSLLLLKYQGSSSLLNYRLLEIYKIDDSDEITVYGRYNNVIMTMDLRRFTIALPYKKTNKKINFVY